jgi:hypothetical protein
MGISESRKLWSRSNGLAHKEYLYRFRHLETPSGKTLLLFEARYIPYVLVSMYPFVDGTA